MMIDVNPNFGRAHGRQSGPKPILNRSIERDRNVDIFRIGRRSREQIRARKETVFLEHAFFVPNAHVFAEPSERETQRKLTPERVTIWPDTSKTGQPSLFAQGLADLPECGCVHSFFLLSES